jgi:hypothetical protein
MNLRNRVSICTLIIGLICPFTQVARGQQSGPVPPPPATTVEGFKEAPEALPSRTWRNGTGLPSFQLFAGLNFQYRKKTD